jgi:PadR family transcriptional regulator PadR
MVEISKDLIAITSVPLILSILEQEESYGYDIIKKIKTLSGGKLQFSDGTIYPILRKLEDKGFISSEWRVADNEKRRRYYQITELGQAQFKEEKRTWEFLENLLSQLWNQPKTKFT